MSKKVQAEKAEQRKKAHEEMLEKRRGSTSGKFAEQCRSLHFDIHWSRFSIKI